MPGQARRMMRAHAQPLINNGKIGFSPGGGFPWLSDSELEADLNLMVAGNATWVRIDFARDSIHTSSSTYNWANMDRVISACRSKGLKVLGLVFGTPVWDRPSGSTDKYGPDTSARYANFANFCTAAATRYDETEVTAWEVWNEANIPIFWQPAPNVSDYISTLMAATNAFRAVRTTQPILTAGTSPATDQPNDPAYPSHSPTAWLTRLYAGGAKPYFDHIAHHPYHYPYLRTDGDASWNAYQQVPALRSTMVSNEDSMKQIWLTEFGCPTGTAADATTESSQSTIIIDGFSYAIQSWPYLGVMFNYSLRDAGTDLSDREQNFGLVRYDRTPKIVCSSFPSLAFLPPAL